MSFEHVKIHENWDFGASLLDRNSGYKFVDSEMFSSKSRKLAQGEHRGTGAGTQRHYLIKQNKQVLTTIYIGQLLQYGFP